MDPYDPADRRLVQYAHEGRYDDFMKGQDTHIYVDDNGECRPSGLEELYAGRFFRHEFSSI